MLPLLIGSIGLGLLSSYLQAQAAEKEQDAQNKANEYNAGIMDSNADLADEYANEMRTGATPGVNKIRAQTAEIRSSMTADYANAGTVTTSGSAAQANFASHFTGEEDAMTYKANVMKEAQKYNDQANQYRQQATLARMGYRDPSAGTPLIMLSGLANAGSKVVSAIPAGTSTTAKSPVVDMPSETYTPMGSAGPTMNNSVYPRYGG